MATGPDRLKTTLNELLAELGDVQGLDVEEENRLRAAIGEIQTVLKQHPPAAVPSTIPPPPAPGGIIDRLSDAALRLEESHPNLATAIGNLAGILGQMGF